MRKADYAALAAIILEARTTAKQNENAWPPDSGNSLYWQGAENKARDIAHRFADRASVNKTEFLKACGITP